MLRWSPNLGTDARPTFHAQVHPSADNRPGGGVPWVPALGIYVARCEGVTSTAAWWPAPTERGKPAAPEVELGTYQFVWEAKKACEEHYQANQHALRGEQCE